MLKKLIDTFCKNYKMDIPPENKEKTYKLKITDTIDLFFLDKEKEIYLFTYLHELPKESREDLFLNLMKGNFVGQGTGKSLIGIDETEKFLTLSCVLPYESTYKEFKENIEDFVNFTIFWRAEITEHIKKAKERLY